MTHYILKDELCALFLSSLTINSERSSCRQRSPITIHSMCHVAGTITKKHKERKHSFCIKRALLFCFLRQVESADFEGGGNDARPSPKSHRMMRRRKYVGKWGCFTSEDGDLELLQSGHPSREETRIFTALIQVYGVPDGYSGPRQSGRKQRGLRAEKLSSPSNVGFYGEGRGERKPAKEFKRIVCKLS